MAKKIPVICNVCDRDLDLSECRQVNLHVEILVSNNFPSVTPNMVETIHLMCLPCIQEMYNYLKANNPLLELKDGNY